MSDLRSELQSIYDKHGKLTPSLVVEEARSTKHPLHKRVFDLGVPEAAEEYYRARAHELIRSVRITYREDDQGLVQGRAWISVRSESNEYVFEPTEKVAADPVALEVVLRNMQREWRALQRRYQHLEEFGEMISGSMAELKVAA